MFVRATAGGSFVLGIETSGFEHAGLGTHNAIFSFGDDAYFEIVQYLSREMVLFSHADS